MVPSPMGAVQDNCRPSCRVTLRALPTDPHPEAPLDRIVQRKDGRPRRRPRRRTGRKRADCDRGRRHRRPGQRVAAARGRAMPSRCSRPTHYLGGHTHTVDVTLDGVTRAGRHRLPRLQRPHLSAPDRAVRRARRRERRRARCRSRCASTSAGSNGPAPTSPRCSRSRATRCGRTSGGCSPTSCASTAKTTAMVGERRRAGRSRSASTSTASAIRAPFRDWYLLPMAAAIWSSPKRTSSTSRCRRSSASATTTGCSRSPTGRSGAPWSAARRDVRARRSPPRCPTSALATPVTRVRRTRARRRRRRRRRAPSASTRSCSPATATRRCALLADPSPRERDLLGAIRYQPNRVVLHTDAALLPRSRRAWSAWNYLAARRCRRRRGRSPSATSSTGCSRCRSRTPVIVTLNPPFEPEPRAACCRNSSTAHPLLDEPRAGARSAASPRLQGERHTWYAGAWLGYGFHEDGLAVGARRRRRDRAPSRARRRCARARRGLTLAQRAAAMTHASFGRTARPRRAAGAAAAPTARSPRRGARRSSTARSRTRATRPAAQRVHLSGVLPAPAAVAARARCPRAASRYNAPRRWSPSTTATTARRRQRRCCRGSAALLAAEGIAADGEIVLYAFPRMLGYVFNPVSFWVCHDRDGGVRAVLCEVRNTFGERHNYLLAHPRRPAARVRRDARRRARCSTSRRSARSRAATRSASTSAPTRWLARIDYFDDDSAASRCSRRGSPARAAPLDRAARARRCRWRYRLFTARRGRAHPLAGAEALARSACRSSQARTPARTDDPMTTVDNTARSPLHAAAGAPPTPRPPHAPPVRRACCSRCSARLAHGELVAAHARRHVASLRPRRRRRAAARELVVPRLARSRATC